MNYYKEVNGKLVCLLCHHYCQLKKQQTGLCGVNKNTGEQIECLVYGYIAALNIDPIEKKPLYHFLPASRSLSLGTVGCNFKCAFCQNWGISQEKEINKEHYFSPSHVVKLALSHHCQSISYTYNEPTIFYPYAKEIAKLAHKEGLKNVFVSNGFESIEVVNDMAGLIDAVNIDLKTFNENYYKKLGGSLEIVLRNLELFKEKNIWTEVTTLIVPTKNDMPEELESLARFIKEKLGETTPWHISAFHPDYKEKELPPTSLESLNKAYEIGKKMGLKYVYRGNVSVNNDTFCSHCQNVLIQRERMQVVQNHLKNGQCQVCKKPLEGVYNET